MQVSILAAFVAGLISFLSPVRAAVSAGLCLDALGNRGRTVAARGKIQGKPARIFICFCHGFLGGVHSLRGVG